MLSSQTNSIRNISLIAISLCSTNMCYHLSSIKIYLRFSSFFFFGFLPNELKAILQIINHIKFESYCVIASALNFLKNVFSEIWFNYFLLEQVFKNKPFTILNYFLFLLMQTDLFLFGIQIPFRSLTY